MMKVLLCGGGNAIHVLASYIGSLPDCEACILSLFPGEAEKLRNALSEVGIKCKNDLGAEIFGKPLNVSNNPAAVVPGCDVIILALPSFTHPLYLNKLKDYLVPGVMIGSMPGQSGFDLCARHILGSDFVHASSIFCLETLPWACRILEYGQSVQVLGTKKEIGVAISPPHGQPVQPALDTLQKLVGPLPILKPTNFLALTLMNPNTVHPTISYGFYRHKDLTQPFDEPPVFYQGVDAATGEMLSKVSDEVMEVRRVLLEKYPSLNLSSMLHLRDAILRHYPDDIGDKTSIHTMLQTSKAHHGLTHPMREVETPKGEIKYMPNFKYRYFTEDLPCGMVVIRGIAELAEVPTPTLDEVIMWCQKVMGSEFLVEGKVAGKDLDVTRCPQIYGFTDLDTFLKANDYVD